MIWSHSVSLGFPVQFRYVSLCISVLFLLFFQFSDLLFCCVQYALVSNEWILYFLHCSSFSTLLLKVILYIFWNFQSLPSSAFTRFCNTFTRIILKFRLAKFSIWVNCQVVSVSSLLVTFFYFFTCFILWQSFVSITLETTSKGLSPSSVRLLGSVLSQSNL